MPDRTDNTNQKSDSNGTPLSRGLTLAIGSMPHQNPKKAIALILDACPEAPCWPQLPTLGFQEAMVPQFSEGFPNLCVDSDLKKIYFSSQESNLEALTLFYERCMAAEYQGDLSPFAFSNAYARPTARLDRHREVLMVWPEDPDLIITADEAEMVEPQ